MKAKTLQKLTGLSRSLIWLILRVSVSPQLPDLVQLATRRQDARFVSSGIGRCSRGQLQRHKHWPSMATMASDEGRRGCNFSNSHTWVVHSNATKWHYCSIKIGQQLCEYIFNALQAYYIPKLVSIIIHFEISSTLGLFSTQYRHIIYQNS